MYLSIYLYTHVLMYASPGEVLAVWDDDDVFTADLGGFFYSDVETQIRDIFFRKIVRAPLSRGPRSK